MQNLPPDLEPEPQALEVDPSSNSIVALADCFVTPRDWSEWVSLTKACHMLSLNHCTTTTTNSMSKLCPISIISILILTLTLTLTSNIYKRQFRSANSHLPAYSLIHRM